MKKKLNIAVVGLGQIGIYLYNELNQKKRKLKLKQVERFIYQLFLQKIKIKKENLKSIKKFFIKTL